MFFFSFLKLHWQTALIASGILALGAAFTLERLEIHHLSAELARCRGENITLETSNKALLASIFEQNAAVDALAAKARSNSNAAARQRFLAHSAMLAHRRTAQAILSQPSSGAQECADMKRLLKDYARNPIP